MRDIKEILGKYERKLEEEIKTSEENVNFSKEYLTFKSEMAPEFNRYEKWCKSLGNLIKLNISEKDKQKIGRHLEIAHLDIEPWQAITLSFMVFFSTFILGALISAAIFLIGGSFPFLFFFLILILALFLFYYMHGYPERIANKWRLKASSQMVPCILYIVVYMRHTANFEKAIAFASEHLEYPLALDFKKVFYDVQVGKFSSIKDSLDNYLQIWKDYSIEFVESFNLIESSLYEPDETTRIRTLEKSLQIVLDGVYDNMLKFTHDVRSPLTNVYMLAVVLPVLGIALLPLASAMLEGMIKWYHIMILYNLILPFMAFYLTNNIMMKRPGGYGDTSLLEKNKFYPNFINNRPYAIAFLICLPFFILGLLPFIFQYTPIPGFMGINKDFSVFGINFFDFKSSGNGFVGPFGMGALFLSLLIPLGIGLFFSISYRYKTEDIIKDRDNTRQLENEFNSSLFQLGNRLGDGVPPELVFGKIAESSRGLKTEDFFRRVNYNIKEGGMSVERAIFDNKRGAIIYYPSELIATSMGILIESSKKGLKIASVSLISISEYVKNIQKINMRLKDMLAEVVSDMKSNMTFLTPLLSGIVIGLASMLAIIFNKLDLAQLSGEEAMGLGADSLSTIVGLFNVASMIPPYFLQLSIGIYIIEIIFVLTGTLVTIDNGEDKLEKTHKIGKNLFRGIVLYSIVAFASALSLSILASVVLTGL